MVVNHWVQPEALRDTPLFVHPTTLRAFTHAQCTTLLAGALRYLKATNFPDMVLSHYSWHSFRTFLCTALMNANTPIQVVQDMLRWQTTRSIHDYHNWDASKYADTIEQAIEQRLTTARAVYLAQRAPQTDPDERLYHDIQFEDDPRTH